jgi:hypothetical protein
MTPGLWVFIIAVTIMTGNRAIEKSVDYRKRRKHSGGIDRYDLIATEKMILERVALITDKVNEMDVQFADRLNRKIYPKYHKGLSHGKHHGTGRLKWVCIVESVSTTSTNPVHI